MDRQQLMKFALLALAVLALAYVVSLYSKKQDRGHSGLVDNFYVSTEEEAPLPAEEEAPAQEETTEESKVEEYTNNDSSVQASEPAGQNEVYHQLNSNSDSGKFGLSGNLYQDCFKRSTFWG